MPPANSPPSCGALDIAAMSDADGPAPPPGGLGAEAIPPPPPPPAFVLPSMTGADLQQRASGQSCSSYQQFALKLYSLVDRYCMPEA